jgi:DNA ligase (NAD+)
MSATAAQKILLLRDQLNEHAFLYYAANSPTITDEQYDALFRELVALEKEHPEMADPNSPTQRVGSLIPNGLQKAAHQVPMLSLDNVNNLEEAMAFFRGHEDHEVTIEMKIDGLSLHLDYKDGALAQALTRGDGAEGQIVTENARTIRTVPLRLRKPVTLSVRGEAYWRFSSFAAYNASLPEPDRISNPRNGASGSLQLKDSQEVAKRRLDFVAYAIPALPKGVILDTQEAVLDYLESLGFQSTMTLPLLKASTHVQSLPYLTCLATAEELSKAILAMDAYRRLLDLGTDGLVIKISSLALQRELGEGNRSPKWAAAYKFPPETKVARVTGFVVQVGKTGQITPVAELEPVNLGGAVVQRASVCNQDELDRLGIDVGDYVTVQRSGEVIPKVIGLARPSPTKIDLSRSFKLPRRCPSCGTALERPERFVNFFCPNVDCPDQVFARLAYAVGKDALDIDGCGEVTVRQMMAKAGVKKLSDLFALKDFSFLKPAAARKAREGIELAKSAPFWRKISALSIEGVGVQTCKDLAQSFESIGDMFVKQSELTQAVGPAASASILAFVEQNVDELERLFELGFVLKADRRETGPLQGRVFCITGDLMSGSRPKVIALIEKHGGAVKATVTRKVNYLVRGTGGGSGKAAGAAKYGTQIISEDELFQMIGIPVTDL